MENTAGADDVLLLEDSSGLCEAQPSTTGLTWSCSSDIRLKENVINSTFNATKYLVKIPLFDYTVKKTGERATGWIAQEMLKIYPDLVKEGDDGYLVVSELPQPILIKAIQEQQEMIDELKHENQEIKERVELLEQK